MNKKTLIIMAVLVLATILAGAAIAVIVESLYYPNDVTVTGTLSLYIDGTFYPNGTSINWGQLSAGSQSSFQNMTVVNTGTQNVTCIYIIKNLPAGWSQTWTGNNTYLTPDSKVSAPLTLTISSGAVSGSYMWENYLKADT